MPDAAAIIPAGGAGLRMGLATPKQFHLLAGAPILIHTIRAVAQAPSIGTIILAVPADQLTTTRQLLVAHNLIDRVQVVAGGEQRQDSVNNGLTLVPETTEFVVVHDGVRPLVTAALIEDCLHAARKTGAAIAAVPVKDTLKAVDDNYRIRKTVDREGLWQAQTPQVARTSLLRRALAAAAHDNFIGTDEASLIARLGAEVTVVTGAENNIKITRPGDLPIAEALLGEKNSMRNSNAMRIGHGYDAHRLVEGRPLVLGGVTIDHPKGLLGHSDADVLTHALCDAILGALGEGDIGKHFPDNDPQYKGINSIKLLTQVMELAKKKGYVLANGDVTVIAQAPKLAPHMAQMRKNLARACDCDADRINLKATTTETMGFTGRGEGIATHAVVLMQQA